MVAFRNYTRTNVFHQRRHTLPNVRESGGSLPIQHARKPFLQTGLGPENSFDSFCDVLHAGKLKPAFTRTLIIDDTSNTESTSSSFDASISWQSGSSHGNGCESLEARLRYFVSRSTTLNCRRYMGPDSNPLTRILYSLEKCTVAGGRWDHGAARTCQADPAGTVVRSHSGSATSGCCSPRGHH